MNHEPAGSSSRSDVRRPSRRIYPSAATDCHSRLFGDDNPAQRSRSFALSPKRSAVRSPSTSSLDLGTAIRPKPISRSPSREPSRESLRSDMTPTSRQLGSFRSRAGSFSSRAGSLHIRPGSLSMRPGSARVPGTPGTPGSRSSTRELRDDQIKQAHSLFDRVAGRRGTGSVSERPARPNALSENGQTVNDVFNDNLGPYGNPRSIKEEQLEQSARGGKSPTPRPRASTGGLLEPMLKSGVRLMPEARSSSSAMERSMRDQWNPPDLRTTYDLQEAFFHSQGMLHKRGVSPSSAYRYPERRPTAPAGGMVSPRPPENGVRTAKSPEPVNRTPPAQQAPAGATRGSLSPRACSQGAAPMLYPCKGPNGQMLGFLCSSKRNQPVQRLSSEGVARTMSNQDGANKTNTDRIVDHTQQLRDMGMHSKGTVYQPTPGPRVLYPASLDYRVHAAGDRPPFERYSVPHVEAGPYSPHGHFISTARRPAVQRNKSSDAWMVQAA